MVWKK